MNQKIIRVASQHGEVVMGTLGLGEPAQHFPLVKMMVGFHVSPSVHWPEAMLVMIHCFCRRPLMVGTSLGGLVVSRLPVCRTRSGTWGASAIRLGAWLTCGMLRRTLIVYLWSENPARPLTWSTVNCPEAPRQGQQVVAGAGVEFSLFVLFMLVNEGQFQHAEERIVRDNEIEQQFRLVRVSIEVLVSRRRRGLLRLRVVAERDGPWCRSARYQQCSEQRPLDLSNFHCLLAKDDHRLLLARG